MTGYPRGNGQSDEVLKAAMVVGGIALGLLALKMLLEQEKKNGL